MAINKDRVLSIFVDESGNFGDPHDPARHCIVTLVLHDQAFDISRYVEDLDRANDDLGLGRRSCFGHWFRLSQRAKTTTALVRQLDHRTVAASATVRCKFVLV